MAPPFDHVTGRATPLRLRNEICALDRLLSLTNRDGGDLGVHVQHAVPVHVHQVVPSALLVVTEEVDRPDILETGGTHTVHMSEVQFNNIYRRGGKGGGKRRGVTVKFGK